MPKKIFELAKELDIAPLTLVEVLKARGHKVRNHMAVMTEDMEQEIRAHYSQAGSAASKDESASKVKKKKVAKKKVTKASSATAEEAGTEVEGDEDRPKVVTRRKTVVRKSSSKDQDGEASEESEVFFDEFASEEEETNETEEETSETVTHSAAEEEQEIVARQETSDEKAPEVKETKDTHKPAGLRIVARPTQEDVAKKAAAATVNKDKPQKKVKEYYEEKVHTFTPVFIPEKTEAVKPTTATTKPVDGAVEDDEDDDDKKKGKKRLGGLATMMSGKKPVVSKSQALTLSRAESELKSYAALSGIGKPIYTQIKKKRSYVGPSSQTNITEVKEAKRIIQLHKGATINDLAHKLSVKLEDLIDRAIDMNLLLKADDYVGIGLATEIASLYSYRVEDKAFDEDKIIGKKEVTQEEVEKLPLRDPIITIMGHVDHGKTTLLDYIRKAKVAQGEAGGITQHIGAYSVSVGKKTLTFLDTPGHAAFAAMRQRGADITDIVVLVVAADDGVMPQTKESIRYCQQAQVPIIVAVNKMDKEGVNPDRIKQELTEFNITPEEWGGDTQFLPISALKGQGVDELLEAIAIQAEMLELRANPKGVAEGVVIESKIEQGRGPVATVLIQTGSLNKGDGLVVGETSGRARSLMDYKGQELKSAGPSTPVQILGLDQAPSPGDILNVVKNEREAKKIVENRINERKALEAVPSSKKKVSLEDFFASAGSETQDQKALNLIVRSDVQGSFEAIKESLTALSNKEVDVKVITGGAGPITDSDVMLAVSAKAYIVGFNMRPVTSARKLAEQNGIDVRTYSIIYELINDVKMAIEGLLDPIYEEQFIGRAEVKETFTVPKFGTIAGSMVVDGKIQVGCKIRLLRNGKIMHDGELSSLKRFKDDAKEVKSGLECGIGLKDYNDVKVGDIFEAYLMNERRRSYDEVAKEEERKARAKKDEASTQASV